MVHGHPARAIQYTNNKNQNADMIVYIMVRPLAIQHGPMALHHGRTAWSHGTALWYGPTAWPYEPSRHDQAHIALMPDCQVHGRAVGAQAHAVGPGCWDIGHSYIGHSYAGNGYVGHNRPCYRPMGRRLYYGPWPGTCARTWTGSVLRTSLCGFWP